MNNVTKIFSYIAFVFAFCCMAIGYAAVQDTLLVNGTVSVMASEQAYAVYCDDDKSLEFFYGRVPNVGGISPEKKTVTAVYTGIEETGYSRDWASYASKIKTVRFIGGTEENGTHRKIQPLTMSSWFSGFTQVTSFNFSGLDTSKVTSMYYTFNSCSSLKELDVTSFNTRNVTTMQGMFLACKKVKEFDVSNFNTSNVENMQHMFSVCYAVEALDLSTFNTSKVTNMSFMFSANEGNSKLKNIDLSSFNTSIVSNMNNMFKSCEQLTVLDLQSFDTRSLTQTASMFYGCKELISIFVSDAWDVSKVSNDDSMFGQCYKITGSNGTTYNDAYKGKTYAIIDGTNGKPGYLSGNIIESEDFFAVYGDAYDENRTLMYKGLYFYKRELFSLNAGETITLPDGSYQIVEESYNNFTAAPWSNHASNISVVRIVDEIHPSSTAYWFKGFNYCTRFLGLSNLKTDKVTNMTNMFRDCTFLSDSDLSEFTIDTAVAKSLDGMFWNCKKLTNSNSNTFNFTNSAVTANANAEIKLTDLRNLFRDCVKLQKMDLTNLLTAKNNVYFAYMFAYCETITTIDFSDREVLSFAPISAGVNKNQFGTAYMFANCWNLAGTVDISFIKCKTPYVLEMFSNCYEITTIIADVNFGYDGNSSLSMFANCDKLVGGNGTRVLDTGVINSTYARIDGVNGEPGYFTEPAA